MVYSCQNAGTYLAFYDESKGWGRWECWRTSVCTSYSVKTPLNIHISPHARIFPFMKTSKKCINERTVILLKRCGDCSLYARNDHRGSFNENRFSDLQVNDRTHKCLRPISTHQTRWYSTYHICKDWMITSRICSKS
jgi:hypothetical protein